MRRFILVVGALFISTGCIALPGAETFDPQDRDKPKGNVRRLLGEAGSDRPVRVGQTRAQLHAVLGTPLMLSADKSTESYGFYRHHGRVFGLIPLGHLWGDQTSYDHFDLVLRFDPEDRLSAWEFGETAVRIVGVPPDYRIHRKAGETELYYVDREKGWPTTRPR